MAKKTLKKSKKINPTKPLLKAIAYQVVTRFGACARLSRYGRAIGPELR